MDETRNELDALMRFAGKALNEARMESIGDWDGGDIQDAMVACDLLVAADANESCGEGCVCAEFGFPTVCYRLTELAKRCLFRVAAPPSRGTAETTEETMNDAEPEAEEPLGLGALSRDEVDEIRRKRTTGPTYNFFAPHPETPGDQP